MRRRYAVETIVDLCEEWVGRAGGGGVGSADARAESLEFRAERDRIVVAFPSR